MREISKTYDQSKESKIYKLWESSGYFNPDNLEGKPFTIMMPPPNATGTLHIGHAFETSIQDIMTRYHRMKGKKTLWLPGTDHAAIATNTKVEKILIKETGKNRHDLGREAFVKKVKEFVENSRGTIQKQIRTIGASADWSREAFTFDDERSVAVKTAFQRLYQAGLLETNERVVNWDVKGQTTVSDDEIVYEKTKGMLYTFKYAKDFPFAISTTRPETKLGDTAVAVHPDDKRYQQYIGKTFVVEFAGIKLSIKVVGDESIDPEFGTGAVGVTPSHSKIDEDIAIRHKLERKQVFNEYLQILDHKNKFGQLAGIKIKEAREKVLKWLDDNKLLEKTEEIEVNIPKADRSGGVIDFLPKRHQWFVVVNKEFEIKKSKIKGINNGDLVTLKKLMRQVVENGQIKILPGHFEKIYYHWIDNLRDWNINRQLFYGHEIPVWYCGGVEKAAIPKMGVHGTLVAEWLHGKTRTYRLRDHGLQIGEKIVFENSATKTLMGYGIITGIQKTAVGGIELPDIKHSGKYKTTTELMAAFQRMHPEKNDIIPHTPAWIYDFEFEPLSKQNTAEGCGQAIAAIDTPDQCPACGGKKLEQDPDTLDTWFSSALWTFSTLGWPNKTKDLKTFHPTTVMAPGYEILFFWVARMILMSTFLLGEVPFRTVYLHGIVRDIQGKKFSKSLDNGIDPVEVIKQYGADALRMALVVGVGAGNDSKYDQMKVKGYRNFANKIWNASRFVLQNLDSPPFKEGLGEVALTKDDQAILKELDALVADTTKLMDSFDFAHAAENLYHYFWHTFADKIIEEAKPKLADEKTKASAQRMLSEVLETNLKLLHPFIPFVTETIWQVNHKDLLMIQQWPK